MCTIHPKRKTASIWLKCDFPPFSIALAPAVSLAHDESIAHLDLAPNNILVTAPARFRFGEPIRAVAAARPLRAELAPDGWGTSQRSSAICSIGWSPGKSTARTCRFRICWAAVPRRSQGLGGAHVGSVFQDPDLGRLGQRRSRDYLAPAQPRARTAMINKPERSPVAIVTSERDLSSSRSQSRDCSPSIAEI